MSVLTLTQANFDAEVRASDKPVLVDFWASWCGPCQMMSPVVDQVAESRSGLKVGKVNTDENGPLAASLGIASIPTLIVFKDGKELARSVGFRPKADLEAWLAQLGV